jgi:hypothetical protein
VGLLYFTTFLEKEILIMKRFKHTIVRTIVEGMIFYAAVGVFFSPTA